MELDCNPYAFVDNIPTWRLRLACRVQSDSSNQVSFDVHWFHRRTDDTVEDLGPLRTTINDFYDTQVEFGFNILDDHYDESMLGDYWCHVIHDSSSSSPVNYGISNVLTIYPPDNYNSSLLTCSEIPRNFTNICADYPFVLNNTTSTMMNTAGGTESSSSSIADSTFSITSMIITSAIVTDRIITSTTSILAGRPSAINETPSDILNKRTDADLILAASIGGAMFILIILLFVIIAVLLCTKNRKRKTNSG